MSEPDYEAALRALADALRALRRNHISLLPRHEFAITDDAGIQRMELEQAVKLAVDAALVGRKVLPLPDKETPVTTTSVTYPNIACHICGRLDGVHKLDCPA